MPSRWYKHITRRVAIQVIQQWNNAALKPMQETYGVSVLNTLVFHDLGKTEYYIDRSDWDAYLNGLYNLLENEAFLKTFHSQAKKVLETILMNIQKHLSKDLSSLSSKKLADLFQNIILPQTEQFYVQMWTVFNIAEPLADVLRQRLKEKINDDKKVDKLLIAFTAPLKPNDALQERIDLLALAKKKMGLEKMKEALQNHTKQYQHIPLFDFDHELYSLQDFERESRQIKDPRKELAAIQQQFSQHQAEYDLAIRLLRPDVKLQILLDFVKDNVFLRDYRDMIRQKLNMELRTFYQEVARRMEISLPEVALLTTTEIMAFLGDGKLVLKQEIQARQDSFLFIQESVQIRLFSGEEARQKAQQELQKESNSLPQFVQGKSASPGMVRGPAKLVFTNKDLPKVKEGDILITAMTRQDFLPAMRKAAALVADEGGIISHIAITAREMGKPCIIGCRIALEVFHDNDLVEVDATKGTLKRLSPSPPSKTI